MSRFAPVVQALVGCVVLLAAGDAAAQCGPGLIDCGAGCINPQSDNENCGSCFSPCPPGQRCEGGQCVLNCQLGLSNCSGICTNLFTDNQNCGFCGNACPEGERCENGGCVPCGTVVGAPDVADASAGVVRLAVASPFRSVTHLTFSLPREGFVALDVFDLAGKRVATLLDLVVHAGAHTMTWNGTSGEGAAVPAGVYFVHLKALGVSRTAKVVLVR